MGFATSPATSNALANLGIRPGGYRWRWEIGAGGGTYPPHKSLNGRVRGERNGFGVFPGLDVNGDHCMCRIDVVYRDIRGRIATGPQVSVLSRHR